MHQPVTYQAVPHSMGPVNGKLTVNVLSNPRMGPHRELMRAQTAERPWRPKLVLSVHPARPLTTNTPKITYLEPPRDCPAAGMSVMTDQLCNGPEDAGRCGPTLRWQAL